MALQRRQWLGRLQFWDLAQVKCSSGCNLPRYFRTHPI